MAIRSYRGISPRLGRDVFVAPSADVIGDVTLGDRSSVWFNAVIRGDRDLVRIGAGTNVQDGVVIHTDPGAPCVLGDECTIGHGAVVHGCRVGDGSLMGMGAVVLSGAEIGPESVVGAGCLIPEGRSFPARALILGVPGKIVRSLRDDEVETMSRRRAATYVTLAAEYLGNNPSG